MRPDGGSSSPAPRRRCAALWSETLRDAILAGSLRAGVRLPASRALACELGVSRGVVSDAYAQLASQGFLISRTRAVPIVADAARPAVARTPVDPRPAVRYDLTPRLPDIALFPLRRWLASEHRVAREAGSVVLSYRDPRGERTLREALADHLGRTRGVIADPDEIFITQGAGQSIDLMLRVLSARGAIRVALEDPSQVVLRKRRRRTDWRINRSRSTSTAWSSTTSLATPSWSCRRTSSPPGRCSLASAGADCSRGPARQGA